MANEDIRFQMGMDVQADSVDQAKQKLKELSREMEQVTKGVKLDVNEQDIEKTKTQISALERSIKEAERSGGSFGNIFEKNMKEITAETKKAASQMNNLDRESKQFGTAGQRGFQSVSKAAKLATADIRGTQTQMDKLRTNLEQGLGQTIAFGAIGAISGGFIKALDTVKDLDEVSTDLRIVTGQTAGEMEAYRDAANEAADTLGTTTQKYLEASLIYKQQGGEAAYYAKELAESTVVAANISGVATDEMSEYLTSTINGFEMLAEKGGEAGTYVTDVLAKLGAASGSDLAEVATGLTRVASTAKSAGYEFEEISSMIATVSERTRQSPETIGNAFKSILANFTQLKEAGEDEVNAFTSKVEEAFKSANLDISIFDNGQLRDAADIFDDIAAQWDTMNKEQQSLVATSVAGKYQMENFMSFMNSQERYQDLLGQAYESAGTAANQQLVYMDSIQSKVDGLSNAWQGAVNTIVDSDMFKGVLEDLTNAVSLVSTMESGAGGLAVALAPLIGIGGNFFAAPKMKDSYINSQMNKGLMSDKDIENSIKSLQLQEDHQKRLIEEKKKERDITKEVNEIMSNLGPEAAARYQQMSDEAEKLHQELELVIEDEKERAEVGKKIAQQIEQGRGPKGINSSRLTEDANANMADPDFEKDQKAKIAGMEQELSLAKELQQIYGTTKEFTAFNRDKSNNASKLEGWRYSAESLLLTESKLTEEQKKQMQLAHDKISKIQDEGDYSLKNLSANKELGEQIELIRKYHEQTVEAQDESVKKAKENLIIAKEQLDLEARGAAATTQLTEKADVAATNRGNLRLMETTKDKMKGLSETGKKLQKGISGLSTAYQAVVPLIATYKAAQEGSLTTSEAMTTGIQSLSGALLMSMNPWGMAAGVAVGAFVMIADHFEIFKTKAEKAKETNEELIKSFMSLQEQISSNQQNLAGIENSYNAFKGVDAEAFLNNKPDASNEEAMKKYTEQLEAYDDIAGKIAVTNPELVKGYDNTGRAIIDLSKSYEDLVKIQEKAATDNYQMLSENSESFITQQAFDLQDSTKKLDEYTSKVRESKEDLEKAKTSGDEDGVSKALKSIGKYQGKISEIKTTLSEVKGSIQTNVVVPFNQSNESFNQLLKDAPELANTFKSFSDNYMNADTISSFVSQGDEESVNNLMDNLEKIRNKYTELAKTDPAGAQQFLDNIAKSSEYAKQALYDTSDNVDELVKKINESPTAFEDARSKSASIVDNYISEKDMEEARKRISKLQDEVGKASKNKEGYNYDLQSNQIRQANGILEAQEKLNKELEKTANSKVGKKYNEMFEQLSEISEMYDDTTKTVEGFNQALEDSNAFGRAGQLIEQIGKEGMGSGALDELKQLVPEYAENLEEAAEKGGKAFDKAIEKNFQTAEATQDAIITSMMGNNEEFFDGWIKANAETVNNLAKNYGIDAANYATMNQFKAALENLSLEQLRAIAGAKTKVQKDEGNKQLIDESNKLTNMTTLTAIWGDNSLSIFQKIHVSALEIWDSIANAWGEVMYWMEEKFRGFLNVFHKGFGNTVSKIAKATGNKELAKQADAWGEGGTGVKKNKASTRADDALAKYKKQNDKEKADRAKKAQTEAAERESLIQQIINSQTSGSTASDIASGLNLLNPQQVGMGKTQPGEIKNNDNPAKNDPLDKKEDVENLELELDRYYKLENLLKRVEDRYEQLSQAKDAVYGQDKLNIMQQEQNLLQERAGILQSYNNELNKEQSELRNKLSSQGFTFDANGDVANLNQRLTALQNAANAKTGEAKEKAIEDVKKLQEDASRYSEITFDLIPDKKKALDEIKKQLSDIARERIEYQIKLQVDKTDLKEQVIDTVKELNQGFASTDEQLQLTGQSLSMSMDEINFYKDKINQIKNDSGLTDADRQDLLQDANKSLLTAVSNAQSAYEELGDIQTEYVQELKEAFDVINERYENILDKSDTLIEKTAELYGARGYGKIQEYYKVQEEALNDQLAYLVDAQKELIRYRDSLDKSSDAWKEANDAVNEMGENIEANLLKKLESVQKQFEAFTENLESKFQNMFGTWGFAGAQEDFDKLIDKQDKYFNSFEKLSTIGQKIKSINEEIAKTNDPKRAAELTALREKEYDTLLKGEKVSQDDYERAEKLYQIKLKELALEERQNAKRIAQLVRDENGNISYEYVRQETEDMQEELDELQKQKDDLYKFDSDKVRESAQGVFDVISKYQEQIKDLQSKGLNEGDYKKELQKLLDDAEGEIKDKTDEMNKWLADAGKDGISSLENMINKGVLDPEELGLDENTLQSVFSALNDGSLTIQDMLSGDYGDFTSSLGQTSEELKSQMDSMLELILGDNFDIAQAMIESSNKWTNTAQTNVNLLGDAYSQYMSQADSVLQQYNNSTGTLNALLNITNAAANTVISTTKNQTNAMIQSQQQTDKYSSSVNNLTNKLVGANGLYSGMVQVNRTMNENLQPSMVATGNITDVLSNKTNNSANKYRSMAREATSAYTRVNAFRDEPTKRSMDRIDEITSKSNRSASAFRSINTDASKARQSVLDFSGAVQNLKSYGAYKLDTGGLVSGATGMYTGTWNNSANNADGRLALLHEKEIVLNKSDTQNLLDAVHMQRDLLKSVEGRGDAAGTMVNRMSSNIQNVQNNSTQTVSQPVTIYADFPNVQKSVEIENAFAGMFTQASTYIGKKN